LELAAQFEAGLHPGHVNLLEPLSALLISGLGGALILAVLGKVIPRVQRATRLRISRRRRLYLTANAERRARAMMDELCPYGWRAQITLITASEEPRGDRPDGQRDRVALDWTAFVDESKRVAAVRRVWAPTISEALDAMVADRRTDETLQNIEQAALADGVRWPDC
jgi:hypothetical protein